jgi:hypothetical protein
VTFFQRYTYLCFSNNKDILINVRTFRYKCFQSRDVIYPVLKGYSISRLITYNIANFEIARFNCIFTGIKVTNNENLTHGVLVATRIYLLLEGLCNSCIHVFNGDLQRLILRMKTNVSILNNAKFQVKTRICIFNFVEMEFLVADVEKNLGKVGICLIKRHNGV